MEAHSLERKKRNGLVDFYLGKYTCLGDNDSLFRWLILPKGVKENIFVMEAKKKGVVIFPSEKFAIGMTAPVNAVRIALTTQENIDEFEKGLRILLEILEERM